MKFFRLSVFLSATMAISCSSNDRPFLPEASQGLHFSELPAVWDEAVPIGNGLVGALIWKKDGRLRLGLDRADLWDLRDVPEFDSPDYSYEFVIDQVVNKRDMSVVDKMIDQRTRESSFPTKIPAGGLEFDIAALGEVESVDLDIADAVCDVVWKNGAKAQFFIPADACGGYFRFENAGQIFPELTTPAYEGDRSINHERQGGKGNSLATLGYSAGNVDSSRPRRLLYTQEASCGVSYTVEVRWDNPSQNVVEGWYEILSAGTPYSTVTDDFKQPMTRAYDEALKANSLWWKNYWCQSAISLPDSLLERQWYLEMYKFAASSRRGAPPASLQAVWTADNGETPPWRGDFHNDLNTQMSYWPAYVANHLDAASSFTDWLWLIKDNSETFTRKFFRVEGLNVPGIATLTGKPLGGWEQYSHSPSAAGWLAWHFYQQWRYGMDGNFLAERAYPWVSGVARFFENISVFDEHGLRRLPLSSSPEINDNTIDAWFTRTTNYDLANIRITYIVAEKMAEALGLDGDAAHFRSQLAQWPDLAAGESGLLIAPDYPLSESHRHLSHLMGIYPFGLVDIADGDEAADIIARSIEHEKALGSSQWTGYSFAWFANVLARAGRGDEASECLHIFAEAFCSPNSFHLNGDQSGRGYSDFTYRPFTLEGNFAFAAGVQEMLIQSHGGIIKVFPAIPSSWKDVSFKDLRTEGAFLVSASLDSGRLSGLSVYSEKGGHLRLKHPLTGEIVERDMKPGERMELSH